jgi:hypothetical protein
LVEDCEFYNGENNFSGHTNSVAILNNNLFHRSQFTATGSGTGGSQSSLSLSNNLFFGILPSGNPWGFEMTQPSGTAWNAFNNAFDTMKLRSSCTSTNGYNAYITSSNRFTPTNINDIVLSSAFAWQSGPLGDFYHPTNSVLIDEGDVGADVQGLYHFTTLTNQTKETTSTVDIGYHYVAVDSNGKPLDYDTDGVPDYLEDGNGNGIVNSGETDWQGTNDPGLKVFITRPRDGSTVP